MSSNAQRISELLRKMPQPPEDAIPSGLTQGTIDGLVSRTGISVPNDLRSWLMLTNGPCIGPGGFFGIDTCRPYLNIEHYLDIFPSWRTKKWIPIAGDGAGNYYVIPTQNEFCIGSPVLFVETAESVDYPSCIVASDVDHFVIGILEKELGQTGWPFDRQYVTHFDPRIIHYKGVTLPWAE